MSTTTEKHREAAIKFFQDVVTESPHTKFYIATEKPVAQITKPSELGGYAIFKENAACHVYIPMWNAKEELYGTGKEDFRLKNTVYTLASGYSVTQSLDEAATLFWDFISGAHSPWRYIFQYGRPEMLYNSKTGRQSGWILPYTMLNSQSVRWNFVKNFCIACRMPMEKPAQLKLWYKLVSEYAMSAADAYILTSCVSLGGDKATYGGGGQGGGHWPLTFSAMRYKSFVDGQLVALSAPVPELVNGYWNHATDSTPFLTELPNFIMPEKEAQEEKSGHFGYHVMAWPLGDVVRRFYEWRDKHNT